MIWLDKSEYGEVCHAIQTKFGNKIPKSDYFLYGRYFYVYTYDDHLHRIEYIDRVKTEGNEDVIAETIKRRQKYESGLD